jgi:hypothetical protein
VSIPALPEWDGTPVLLTGVNSFRDLFNGGTITIGPDGELYGEYTLPNGKLAVWSTRTDR